MPLPKLTAAQIAWVVQQVAAYIERRRREGIVTATPWTTGCKPRRS